MWNTICYLARMSNLHPCEVINSNRFYVEFHGITLIVYAISIIRTLLFTVYSHAFCVVSIVEVCWLEEREITKSLYWAINLLYKTFRTRRDIAWALYIIKITSQVPHHPKYTQNTYNGLFEIIVLVNNLTKSNQIKSVYCYSVQLNITLHTKSYNITSFDKHTHISSIIILI